MSLQFYRSNKCCDSNINILLFPLIDSTKTIITSSTPSGWYALYPPLMAKSSPTLCFIPEPPLINPYIGWATYSIDSCSEPNTPNEGGRLEILSAFVDDFTESGTVETSNTSVSDNIILASGRHVNPKFYMNKDYVRREMFIVLNPKPSIQNAVTKKWEYTEQSIDRCRFGWGLLRDQMTSHFGHDKVFGSFLNVTLRIIGNYQRQNNVITGEKTTNKNFIQDFIKIKRVSPGNFLLSIADNIHTCCDCPKNSLRIKLKQINITATATEITLIDGQNFTIFNVPLSPGDYIFTGTESPTIIAFMNSSSIQII